MATELTKHLASDAATRARQAFGLTIHLLQRGADPATLEVLLTDVGAKNAKKMIDDARITIRRNRVRECMSAISPESLAIAARELGLPPGHSFTLHVGEEIRAIPIPKAIVSGRFSRNSLAFV